MTPLSRTKLLLALIVLVALVVGGLVGWWMAMRSMPMGGMEHRMGTGMEKEGMGGMQGMAGMPSMPARTVFVDPVRLQRIGVRYAVAREEPLGRTVRAEANVAYDEEGKTAVTTRIAGWVERLYVDKPGQAVRRGQPLLEIYSPELVSTQRELVLALERVHAGVVAPKSPVVEHGAGQERATDLLSPERLVESARRRLELWGVPGGEIDRLVQTREVRRTLTLTAPASGVVVEKNVLAGAKVEPGEDLLTIADVSMVWVEAHVFESDLADVRVGMPARITMKAYPNEEFSGTVAFIYPYLDVATRTTTVRLEVSNSDGRLKPGMFAGVDFDVSGNRKDVVVPSSAVIETGERAFVLVKRGKGLFEPREVRVGERAAERVSVAENLAAGDTVVASANFLIDSEANLMAFMGGMLGMGMPPGQMRMGAQGTQGMQEMQGMEGMHDSTGQRR